MDITINITEQEKTILESWLGVGQIEAWLQHAINNQIRKAADEVILQQTKFNPKKMTIEDKLTALSKR